MGKGGIVLGIIGIMLGAGGLGFGFLIWSNQGTIQENLDDTDNDIEDTQDILSLHRIWYNSHEDIFYPPYLVYEPIPNMSIIVDLGAPVSLHLLFTCSARILSDSTSFSDVFFYFMIDGVRELSPWTRVGPYEGVSTYEYHSVALQHFYPQMTPGTYNFTVVVLSERAGNFIRESTFSIRSYPV
jgi:hypothetical protein